MIHLTIELFNKPNNGTNYHDYTKKSDAIFYTFSSVIINSMSNRPCELCQIIWPYHTNQSENQITSSFEFPIICYQPPGLAEMVPTSSMVWMKKSLGSKFNVIVVNVVS